MEENEDKKENCNIFRLSKKKLNFLLTIIVTLTDDYKISNAEN